MTEIVNGETIEFPSLTLKDLEAIEDRIRANQNLEAEKIIKECGVKGLERAVAVQKLAPNTVTLGSVIVYFETSAGIRKALELSLSKTGISADKINSVCDALGGDVYNACNLAKSLVGLADRVRFGAAGEEDGGPLPEAGGSASSTATEV